MFIVAIPRETGFGYEWIASFETEEAAATYSIKFVDAIVVYNVELLP